MRAIARAGSGDPALQRGAAPVVRDRLIANRSGSAEAAAHIKVLRTFSPCDG